MNGFKDSRGKVVFLGAVVPGAIMALVIVNAVTGRVYWIGQGEIYIFTDAWRVVGTILLKSGFALGLVAWFLFANVERVMKLARPCMFLSVAMTLVGILFCGIGFFEELS
jgi:hypothetical protein